MRNKFKIPHIPATPPTTTKSIRFPNEMIEEVEEAVRIALLNLKEDSSQSGE